MRLPKQTAPGEVAARAAIVKIPLDPAALTELTAGLVRSRSANPDDGLAHLVGDTRFGRRFGHGSGEAPQRWAGAFAAFRLQTGERPSLVGYTAHPLEELAAVPLPRSWAGDPYRWSEVSAVRLADYLEARRGTWRRFVADVFPKVRVGDPGKPVRKKEDRPAVYRTRDLDAHRYYLEHPDVFRRDAPDLEHVREPDRATSYLVWLRQRLARAADMTAIVELDMASGRIEGESTAPPTAFGPSREDKRAWSVLAAKISGRLQFDDPLATAGLLMAGIGRRRAYGHGMLLVA